MIEKISFGVELIFLQVHFDFMISKFFILNKILEGIFIVL